MLSGKRIEQLHIPILPMEADCRIELTELLVQGEHWWTLGLESHGDDETAVSTKLLPAIDWIISFGQPLQHNNLASFGYPQWLLTIL